MANVVCLIVNPTDTAYSNVNAAGDDIAAYSCGSVQTNASGAVTLSDAEMATFMAAHTSALVQVLADTTPTAAELEVVRKASKILRLGKFPATAIA